MTWWRRIVGWFDARRQAHALREELESHRACAQDELERRGLSPIEAAAESRRRMGNVLLAQEDAREVWLLRWADQLRQHVRYGIRGLRREPAFALTAILTLALGTAAATTVFSVVDAEIWRPLPFPEPRRLVEVTAEGKEPRANGYPISMAELQDWRQRMPAMTGLATTGYYARRIARLDRAEVVTAAQVTANYFEVLGRRPIVGQAFSDTDARGSDAVVINERAWRRLFDADPNAIGRAFMLDDVPAVLVGVVPTNDALSPDADIFLPIDERASTEDYRVPRFGGVIGRLAPGISADVARQQLQALLDEGARDTSGDRGHIAAVEDLSEAYKRSDQRPLYFFLSASALVLLLTIVNVAALLLSRVLRRTPEFALRGALGGGTRVVAMQLVTESALIAVPACLVGLWLASQAVGVADSVIPVDFLHRGTRIGLDLRVAGFACIVALVTTAGLALVPWGLARRANINAALGSGGRTSGTAAAGRTRTTLLISQLALTVILLSTAGLFVKSFSALMNVPLGFDPSDGWSMRITLTGPRYTAAAGSHLAAGDGTPLRVYADRLIQHTQAIPGVRAVAVATSSPLKSGSLALVTQSGQPPPTSGGTRAILRSVSSDYFQAIGTRIILGRAIAGADTAGSEPVAVINELMVQQLFDGANPIGRYIDVSGRRTGYFHDGSVRIVGVAADIKDLLLNEAGMGDVYVPFAQQPATSFELIVRGNGSNSAMPGLLRSVAQDVDPSIPATGLANIDQRIRAATEPERFNLMMVVSFAAIAVLIAGIGIYGAMAYAATARRREFGVRLALGATPGALLGAAMWQAARVALIGGCLGVVGTISLALWIGDALYLVRGSHNGLLFNVKTTDPVVLTFALVGIVLVALIGGALPARRVAKVDPVQALRAD